MSTMTSSSFTAIVIYLTIAGVGFAGPLVLVVTVAQLAVPGELLATGVANLLMARGVGGAVRFGLIGHASATL